jgi:plastocyanin
MRTLSVIALLCALAIPVAGCGDDEDASGGSGVDSAEKRSSGYSGGGGDDTEASGGGGGAQTLKISADPGGALAFDRSSLSAKPGRVTIVMDNPSNLPHAVEIEGKGVEVAGETVMKDGVSRATAELEAGEYEYYCPVGNHRRPAWRARSWWSEHVVRYFGSELASRSSGTRSAAGPGQCCRSSTGPALLTSPRRTSATRIASSSWPATGMKSGTRSNGRAR